MRDLAEAARTAIANPVSPPTPVSVLQSRVRSRRLHRRVAAAVAAVCVIAAGVTGGIIETSGARSHPVMVAGPGPQRGLPAGFKRVTYATTSIAVPSTWQLIADAQPRCPVQEEVILGAALLPACAPYARVSYVQLVQGAAPLSGGHPVRINGHTGTLIRPRALPYEEVSFPDLNITVTIYGTTGSLAGTILGTVESSSP